MKRELRILLDGTEMTVTAERSGDEILVEREGERYRVTLLSDTVVGAPAAAAPTPTPKSPPSAAATSAGAASSASSARAASAPSGTARGAVGSPMTGVVDQVLVTAGQSVREGEKIVVLEAMKMYIDVVAPSAGSVREILVTSGDAVKEGQPLLTIE